MIRRMENNNTVDIQVLFLAIYFDNDGIRARDAPELYPKYIKLEMSQFLMRRFSELVVLAQMHSETGKNIQ